MAKYVIHANGNAQNQPLGFSGLIPPAQVVPQQTNPTAQIISAYATQQAQQALNNQKQEQEADPIRETVNELVKRTLASNIDMPKYTTLQDVFNAPKGDRLSTFGEYLNNPDTIRMVGGFLPKFGYNPQTGKTGNILEPMAQTKEAQMRNLQKQAQRQIDLQNEVAKNVYNAYLQKDIKQAEADLKRELAKQELDWAREKFGQELALDRAKFNEAIRHQRTMEGLTRLRSAGSSGGGIATGGAAGLGDRKLSSAEIKQIQKNQEALNSLNAIEGQMDRFKNTFGKVRGSKAGALLANAYASNGFGNGAESNFNAQRTLLFNKIARELGGEKGVLSDQDIKRIETSLPSLSDSLPQKKAKMQAVYDLLNDRKSQYGGISQTNDPMGLGL